MSTNAKIKEIARRHPLQRLDSPAKGVSGVLHAVGLFSFFTAFKFLHDNPNVINESYGWHLQYLTIIGLSLASLCFTSGLLADLTNSRPLFILKNYLALVAAPIEILISVLYWGLRSIDPTLVIPEDLPQLPFLNDLTFHLFPALLLGIDAILFSPPWPTSPTNKRASLITLASSTGIAFAYWYWIELCYTHNGFYPYPIFALLNTAQRAGLFAASGVAMWAIGTGLRYAYVVVNGHEDSTVDKKTQ